jgi:DNA-binding GntR family transcriptional regulator
MLAAEGLVELLPNRGAVAVSLTEEDIANTFEVMAGLESQAGELAAQRITESELAEIQAMHFEMMAAYTRRDLSSYYTLNARIHSAISAAARNPVLAQVYQQVNARLQALRFRFQPGRREVEERHEGTREDDRSPGRARRRGDARSAALAPAQQARGGAGAAARRARGGRVVNAPLPLEIAREAAGNAYDTVSQASNEVAGRLAQRLAAETQGEVLFSPADRGRYATDASIYQVVPVGVFVPKSAEDASIALDICRDLKVPVVPRGGGTSQCGQTVGAASSSTSPSTCARCSRSTADQRTATVEPGIVLDHLKAHLKKTGLWYPVDVSTAAQATLGGMAGNNSCGSRSIAYGNMVHNVLGAQAWTSDGQLHTFGRFDEAGGAVRALGDACATWRWRWPPRSRRTGPRCCAASPATTSTSSTTRTRSRTRRTAASTWRTSWSAAKARWPSPAASSCSCRSSRATRCWAW